jgi:hypothetical protein
MDCFWLAGETPMMPAPPKVCPLNPVPLPEVPEDEPPPAVVPSVLPEDPEAPLVPDPFELLVELELVPLLDPLLEESDELKLNEELLPNVLPLDGEPKTELPPKVLPLVPEEEKGEEEDEPKGLPPGEVMLPLFGMFPPLGPMPAIVPPVLRGWPKKPIAVGTLFCPNMTGFQSSLPVIGSM